MANPNLISYVQYNASKCKVLCALLDVPELRVPVTQLVNLLLGTALQPVVTLPSCSEFILVGAVRNAKQGQ